MLASFIYPLVSCSGDINGEIAIETEVEHGFDTMYIAANEIHEIQLGASALFLSLIHI